MAIVRLGAYTPAANTPYALYNVLTSHLVSVIAANTLSSSVTTTKVDIWVVPQGVSTPSGYAYIASNLEIGLGQSFETFKFGVNAGDTLFIKSTTAGTSFVVQGMPQDSEYSINDVPITFTNKIIRGNDNIVYPEVGTTAQRPSAAETGYWRYNTDLNYIEFKTPNGWAAATGAVGPTGPAGIQGSGLEIKGAYNTLQALQTAHPTGSIGDAYLVNGNLYVWSSSEWVSAGPVVGPTGPTGPSGGPTGPTGAQGVAGTPGVGVIYGSVDPTSSTGVDGQFYINISSNTFFGPRMSGSWPAGVSIVGPTGPAGPATVDNYIVTNSGTTAYVIDGVNNPTLTLVRGQRYFFTVNATGHPFWIQTVSGAYSSGDVYNSGVTNNGASVGGITFTVPLNAPNTLYYVCQNHSAMGGTITVIG